MDLTLLSLSIKIFEFEFSLSLSLSLHIVSAPTGEGARDDGRGEGCTGWVICVRGCAGDGGEWVGGVYVNRSYILYDACRMSVTGC